MLYCLFVPILPLPFILAVGTSKCPLRWISRVLLILSYLIVSPISNPNKLAYSANITTDSHET